MALPLHVAVDCPRKRHGHGAARTIAGGAKLRAEGKPLTSLALADGLIRYSERGQEYVDTLKGIIRVNKLDIADDATFRDEPIRFVVGAEDDANAVQLRKEIEEMRASGELEKIIARMRLE